MIRRDKRSAFPALVAFTGLVLCVVLIAHGLASVDWNPTHFVGFGADATATTDYGTERLEHDLLLRPQQGHDGKFFFVQANDPWILDPSQHASILDYPTYRSQRMLYPLLAGGFGLLDADGIVWALVVVNILAMGLGTWATAHIAVDLGGSALWGFAFVANIGLLYALTSDTAGIVASALAFGAVAFLFRERVPAAVGMLAAAVLAREAMMVCAVGLAIWLWFERKRRQAVYALVLPSIALGSWLVYLRLRLGPEESGPDALSGPFAGVVRAVPGWFEDTLSSVVGLAVLALVVAFVIRWSLSRTVLGWTFVGFVPLATVLSHHVWDEVFDYTRALAPLLTAAVLVIFVETRSVTPPDVSHDLPTSKAQM